MPRADNEIVGRLDCPWCNARVAVKVNRVGKAYFVCNGTADTRACASTATLGPFPTMAAMAEFDNEKEADHAGEEIEAVPEGEPAGGGETGDGAGGDPGDDHAGDGDAEDGGNGDGFTFF